MGDEILHQGTAGYTDYKWWIIILNRQLSTEPPLGIVSVGSISKLGNAGLWV